MTAADIKAAVQRVEAVLTRRPDLGLHRDTPAVARWDHDLSITTQHPNGAQIRTDMPAELGGGGEAVTPGWLMRAGLASCAATCIALAAAAEGITLEALEVVASSQSDSRALLGMKDSQDAQVSAQPRELELAVRIRARSVPAAQLRALVEQTRRCTPVWCAIEERVPVALQIEVIAP